MTKIAYKTLMSLSGLFLCLFLVVHLLGNSQLFLPASAAQTQFNWYASFLTKLTVIKIAAWATYLALFLHAVVGIYLTWSNRSTAGSAYESHPSVKESRWFSNHMGLLGVVILFFLTIHMSDFWWPYTSGGDLGVDAAGRRNLYGLVQAEFQKPWKVMLYVVGSLAVGAHLFHGVYSGVRSVGLFHPGYASLMKWFGYIFAIVIGLGFATLPVYFFLSV